MVYPIKLLVSDKSGIEYIDKSIKTKIVIEKTIMANLILVMT